MENIRQNLEKIASEICDQYCKWPNEFKSMSDDEFEDKYQIMLEEKCENCPLQYLT